MAPRKTVTDDRPEESTLGRTGKSPYIGDENAEPEAKTEPAKRKRRSVTEVLGGDTSKKKSSGRPPNISEGLTAVIQYVGAVIGDKDPGVGAAIRMTAPTSGRVLADGVKRFPSLHSFLGIFLGAGVGARDMVACIEIPRLIAIMERNPAQIPSLLPVVKAHMRPILRDMLKAAQEEKKVRDEIAAIENELGTAHGTTYSVDKMILMDMLGIPETLAERLIAGESPETVFVTVPGTVRDEEEET